jgi:hypothetical protein
METTQRLPIWLKVIGAGGLLFGTLGFLSWSYTLASGKIPVGTLVWAQQVWSIPTDLLLALGSGGLLARRAWGWKCTILALWFGIFYCVMSVVGFNAIGWIAYGRLERVHLTMTVSYLIFIFLFSVYMWYLHTPSVREIYRADARDRGTDAGHLTTHERLRRP